MMSLFGFGKKKEKEKEKEQPKPVETYTPVSVPVDNTPKTPAPPAMANAPCPICQRELGSHPVKLADSNICRPCSLLLREFFFFKISNGVTYDPLAEMALEKAKDIIDITRREINEDISLYADKYSFVADVDDVKEFESGCTLATAIIVKGANPKGRRATIIRDEEVVGYALIEDAIPCIGYDFETSYADNAIDPYDWNTEAIAWLILGIEPSQLSECDIIVID